MTQQQGQQQQGTEHTINPAQLEQKLYVWTWYDSDGQQQIIVVAGSMLEAYDKIIDYKQVLIATGIPSKVRKAEQVNYIVGNETPDVYPLNKVLALGF